MRSATALLITSAAIALAGCSRGPAMSVVTGVVTIDGKPLEKGSITFEPLDGKGATAGATVEDGSYETKAPPGEKKVRIMGYEIVGQTPAYKGMPNSPMRDIVKDIVPARYNSDTELKVTVERSKTTGNFDLKSS